MADNVNSNVSPAPDISNLQGQQTAPGSPVMALPQAPTMPLPNAQPPQAGGVLAGGAPPAPPQKQESGLHKMFGSIFNTLSGGNQVADRNPDGSIKTNPETGDVVMRPGSRKELSHAILAGALSGLAASFARTQDERNAIPKAGTNANRQAQAQQIATADQTRKYTTMKQNLDMHAAMVANDKMDREVQQESTNAYLPMISAAESTLAAGGVKDDKGNPTEFFVNDLKDLPHQKLLEMLQQGNVKWTEHNIIPTNVVEVPNANGQGTHPETLFSVINPNAVLSLTDQMKKENPAWAHVTDIPVPVMLQYYFNKNQGNLANTAIQNHLQRYDEVNKTHLADKFNFSDAVKKNRLIEKLYPWINKYNEDDIDQLVTDLSKDKEFMANSALSSALGALKTSMGITKDGLLKMTTDRNTEQAKKANEIVVAQAAAKTKADEAAKLEAESSPEALAAEANKAKVIAKGKAEGEEEAKTAKVAKFAASPVVDQIGTGQMALSRIDYLLARNPELVEAVTAKYPDFDSSKIKGYTQAVQEYESTKKGSTGNALNGGGTALKHLKDLKHINDENPTEVHIKGTKAYNAYQNLLHTVAGELAQFYNLPQTDQSIQSMLSSLGALVNRNAAILRQAKSMGEKMDSYEQSWENAKPSKHYEKPMPNIDYEARSARAELDPDYRLVPHIDDIKRYNGDIYKFDGNNWNKVSAKGK